MSRSSAGFVHRIRHDDIRVVGAPISALPVYGVRQSMGVEHQRTEEPPRRPILQLVAPSNDLPEFGLWSVINAGLLHLPLILAHVIDERD